MSDLETEGFIDELIEAHDLVYNEQFIIGSCDTTMLSAESTDIVCVPGADVMPRGHIFLALYHPETFEIVAVTSTIDNIVGGATAIGRLALEAQSARADLPAGQDGCGPYAKGQWIDAEDYQSSGLNLPVADFNDGHKITHYQCIAPENGEPYLQAYDVGGGSSPPTQKASDNRSGGGNSGGGGNQGGDDDNSGSGLKAWCKARGGSYSAGISEGVEYCHDYRR